MVCTVCGNERPDRGKCRYCGSRLCCTCHGLIPLDRNSRRCAGCEKEYCAKWRLANLDRERQNKRKWRSENPERRKETDRKWVQSNMDRVEAMRRRWLDANTAKRKEIARKWAADNPESSAKWRAANPEKIKTYRQRRRARKNGCVVSEADLRKVVEQSAGLCALCWTYVPEGLRHIDHIIPLKKGGPHSQENLQLTCYRCNTSKGAKMPDEVGAAAMDHKQPRLLNPDWK